LDPSGPLRSDASNGNTKVFIDGSGLAAYIRRHQFWRIIGGGEMTAVKETGDA
jgi:hypothetical protein